MVLRNWMVALGAMTLIAAPALAQTSTASSLSVARAAPATDGENGLGGDNTLALVAGVAVVGGFIYALVELLSDDDDGGNPVSP